MCYEKNSEGVKQQRFVTAERAHSFQNELLIDNSGFKWKSWPFFFSVIPKRYSTGVIYLWNVFFSPARIKFSPSFLSVGKNVKQRKFCFDPERNIWRRAGGKEGGTGGGVQGRQKRAWEVIYQSYDLWILLSLSFFGVCESRTACWEEWLLCSVSRVGFQSEFVPFTWP